MASMEPLQPIHIRVQYLMKIVRFLSYTLISILLELPLFFSVANLPDYLILYHARGIFRLAG